MAFSESILVRLGLDNSAFNRGLTGAQQGVSKLQMAFKAFAGLAVVGVFKSMIDKARELGDSLGTLSSATGVAASTIQTLRHATMIAGGSAEDADMAFTKLAKAIGDARVNGGESELAFKSLGISLETADGKAKTTEQVFNELADAFAGIDDHATKASFAAKLFGEKSAAVVIAISEGSAELKRMREELEKTGQILTDLEVRELDRFDKATKRKTEAAMKWFSRMTASFFTNAGALKVMFTDVDFFKSFLGDEEADRRWKQRIDAFLFGEMKLDDAKQTAIKRAKELQMAQESENKARAEALKIDKQRADTLSKLNDAVIARDKARRAPALFGSLQELASADISRGATPQLLAQRRQAQFIQFLEANAERLKQAGLVDLSEKGFAAARLRRQNLTLASDDVRNPLFREDEQIQVLKDQLAFQEQMLEELRKGNTYQTEE